MLTERTFWERIRLYFIPLLVLILGSTVLLAGLFPNGFSLLNTNNGNIILGRKDGRKDDPDFMDSAIAALENAIIVMSAIRSEQGDCNWKDGG